jgi:PIN domain nuclease of toxin-antitoxin system
MSLPGGYVLDSCAILAYMEDEPGADEVAEILAAAAAGAAQVWMPVANLGEVLYIIEREQTLQAAQAALSAIDQLPITVIPADRALALGAAHFKAHHRLSYADASVVALAQSRTPRW